MPAFNVEPEYYPDPKKKTDSDFLGYNDKKAMNLNWLNKTIKISEISSDGYSIGVNSRPIRTPHINKIQCVFTGDIPVPDVIWHSEHEFYFIVEGQHAFEAYIQYAAQNKIETKKKTMICRVMVDESGKELDANIKENERKAFMYSFRKNDGQERNCISDNIAMVMKLSDQYTQEHGNKPGLIDYITKNQYSHKKMSETTVKIYHSKGQQLKVHALLQDAQEKRWTMVQIEAAIKRFDLNSDDLVKISFKMCKDDVEIFKERGFNSPFFWNDMLSNGLTRKTIATALRNEGLV